MKYGTQLKLNMNPDWKDHYINYSMLKHMIYQISNKENQVPIDFEQGEPAEPLQPLLRWNSAPDLESTFVKAFEGELARVIEFYTQKEAELFAKCGTLGLKIHQMDGLSAPPSDSPVASQAEDERIAFWAHVPGHLVAQRDELRKEMEALYVALKDLESFRSLNFEGFRKALKKHDKETTTALMPQLMPVLQSKLSSSQTAIIQQRGDVVLHLFAVVVCHGDLQAARRDLDSRLQDEVLFERRSIWQDMVATERLRGSAPQVVPKDSGSAYGASLTGWFERNKQWTLLLLSFGAFAVLLNYPVFDDESKNNCLAMFVLLSLLWSTEALPLFVTSMLVPLLVVILRVLVDNTQDPPVRLTPQDAAASIFHSMFSQTILLLLGGFTIAAALTKHFLAKQLAVTILSRVGRKPEHVLLANMLVATFLSMWISNVASPVLCFSLVTPILRTLPTHHPFGKALVMGIALASNLGGMTSPISSPQNLFAIERMGLDGHPPSWLAWFLVALPVSFLGNLICWGVLLAVYRPQQKIREVRQLKPSGDPITWKQVYVLVVSLTTVGLWCANTALQQYTGEMGVLAIVPLVAFFGFDILNKDDFNHFLWNVVMLAMGGLALGEAVKSSGLLLTIAEAIKELVIGFDLWTVLVIFCGLVLVGTTFISHTVGAMVILPIVQSVGDQLPGPPHAKLLVMGSALMCSGAMGLPVSGFPNMNAVALEDPTGLNYVATIDFLKVGVVCSFFTYGIIVTLGYGLMLLAGF